MRNHQEISGIDYKIIPLLSTTVIEELYEIYRNTRSRLHQLKAQCHHKYCTSIL